MLVVRKDHVRRPPGGHRFPEGFIWLRAESVNELEEKLVAFRANNSRPLGLPADEIAAYYQTIAPFMVRERPERTDAADEREQLAVRTMQMAAATPGLFAPAAPEVESRVEACAGCPFKAAWPDGEASPYVQAADRRTAVLTQRTTPQDAGFCLHHGWALALAQRLTEPAKFARERVENCFAHEVVV